MRALLLLLVAAAAGATERYQVTLRLPPNGLFAQEEMEIEFRVEDTSKPDPLGGFVAVVRLAPAVAIDMPEMAGMPKIEAVAHAEGVPGEYGVHPTFPHGGEYRMRVEIRPPGGEPFVREFALAVKDADAGRKRGQPRFTLEVTSEPRRPRAGKPVELRMRIRDRDNGNAAVSDFETVHERALHLILVRRDLTHFAHEHPVQTVDAVRAGLEARATFRLAFTFPAGGDFRVFADFAPKGAGAQVAMAKLKVDGPEAQEAPLETGGVELRSAALLPSRQSTPMVFAFADASGLEPYLGAAGHLILIHEDGETFVHSHPGQDAVANGELSFVARLPKPGVYRAWLQFQRSGRVVTRSFQVRAHE